MSQSSTTLRIALALLVAASGAACSSSSSSTTSESSTTPEGSPEGTPAPNDVAPADDAGAPATPPSVRDYDVNHVLGTGQSLSLGGMGTPPLSLTQPYENIMFDTGLEPAATAPTSFVPLIETSTFLDAPVETPSSAFANLATKLAAESATPRQHDVLVSLHGVSGASYPEIGKDTDAYLKGLDQVRAAMAIAKAEGKSYVVRAVTVVHGESDGWQNWNVDYDKALLEWQAAFDTDIKAITGQSEAIPMFHSQYSAWSSVEPTPSDITPFLQLEAAKKAPGKIVIVGPKYFLPYGPDGLHLTNQGYRWLGEYYAKAYAKQVLGGEPWEPVRPQQITRSGAVITVKFFVPAPPLVLDTQLVSDPGSYGFAISDDSGVPPAITTVAITGPDTVTLTLAGEPGANPRVRYAYDGLPGNMGGPSTGPRGNLRDSDTTASRYGYKLYDWCVHFDEAVP